MTDLDDYILSVVEDKGPIKNTELALSVASHMHGITGSDVTESLDRLLAANQIIEVEYVLASMDYRVKSLYFPKDTRIKVLSGEST
jgi:hypothetical protein